MRSLEKYIKILHHSKMKRDVYSRKLMIHIVDSGFKPFFFISPFNILDSYFITRKNSLIKIISNYSSDRQPYYTYNLKHIYFIHVNMQYKKTSNEKKS